MPIINLDTGEKEQCGSTQLLEVGLGALGDYITDTTDCVNRNLAVEQQNFQRTAANKKVGPGVTSVYDIPGLLLPYETCVYPPPPPTVDMPMPILANAIPFSPPNVPNPPTQAQIMSTANIKHNPQLMHETKHRRDEYQEMVMCPGGETSDYMMGLDSWKSLDSVMAKAWVMGDMGMMEILGFLTPALVVGGLGYLAMRKI